MVSQASGHDADYCLWKMPLSWGRRFERVYYTDLMIKGVVKPFEFRSIGEAQAENIV